MERKEVVWKDMLEENEKKCKRKMCENYRGKREGLKDLYGKVKRM